MPLQTSKHYASVCASMQALESWAQRHRHINLVRYCRKQYAKYREYLQQSVIKETQPIRVGAEGLHA